MSGGDVRASGERDDRGGTDFDLHGIVGVRLVDATEADVAVVRRQLGPLQRPLERAPDITVRFVDRVTTEALTYVSVGATGYNSEGFFIQRDGARPRAKTRLPFAELGDRPEVICERGVGTVPHLLAMINLTALSKGVLPLHASAFNLAGKGVLVTGWSKAGKTESLLAAMDRGADYIGDEWVYLTRDGEMFGLPEPIRLWSWQLHQVPRRLRARPRRERIRLSGWHWAGAATKRVARSGLPGASVVRKGAPVVGRQAYLQVPPEHLFAPGTVPLRGRLDAVVLLVNHESRETVVESAPGREIAARMTASLHAERAPFMEHYRHFLFGFPDAVNGTVEKVAEVERRLLCELFDGWDAAKVSHPYPCDISGLGDAVASAASMCHRGEAR